MIAVQRRNLTTRSVLHVANLERQEGKMQFQFTHNEPEWLDAPEHPVYSFSARYPHFFVYALDAHVAITSRVTEVSFLS